MTEGQKGYIFLWRQLLKSDVWEMGQKGDKNLLFLFIWCLLKATHSPHEVNKVIVERGQFFTGQHVASKELGITGVMFRRKLKVLKDLGILTTKVVNRFTLVTICNYSTYQTPNLPQPVNRPQPKNGYNTNTIVLEEESVVKRKTKSKPREETKPLITYYSNKYKEIFSEPYHIAWAKDSTCIKRLLDGGFTADRLFKLIDMFLRDEDAFVAKAGHTIPIFVSRINRYVEQLRSEPSRIAPLSGWKAEPKEKTKEQRYSEAKEQILHIVEYNRCYPNPKEECAKRLKILESRIALILRCKEIGDIPDELWRLIHPDVGTNPHRKH